MAVRLREGVRAVVLDDDAVLLVRFEFADGALWATPGGGVEEGESHEDAIRRELDEEVGLRDVALGPVIWTRTHLFALSDDFDGQRETIFLVSSPGPAGAPSMSAATLRAEGLTGARWWTRDELRAAAGLRFAPSRLPELVEDLFSTGPPAAPVDVGV